MKMWQAAVIAGAMAMAGSQAYAAPGDLVEQTRIGGAPDGASAFRLRYRSQDADGREITVSGFAMIPAGTAPANGRAVVAWAHPTTGVIPACAPSRSPLRFLMVPGLRNLLRQGHVVVATDYPGSGDGEVQPFLDGPAEARALLDSVRAARALPGSDTSGRFALWGHSQGGQAVLFAGRMQPAYAPELQLVAVAAAAPATDLATLFRDDLGTRGGNNLTALALWSWARTRDAPYDRVVRPEAMAAIDAVAAKCIDALLPSPSKRAADKLLAGGFLTVPDITRVAPWQDIIARNSAGPLPAQVPLFLAQGGADVIVRPEVTAAYAARQCNDGGRVTLLTLPKEGHGWIASKSAGQMAAWLADRMAGKPAPACSGISALVSDGSAS